MHSAPEGMSFARVDQQGTQRVAIMVSVVDGSEVAFDREDLIRRLDNLIERGAAYDQTAKALREIDC